MTEIFPLLRGRTGVEILRSEIPVVIRLYRGSKRLSSHRVKLKSKVRRKVAYVGVKPVTLKFRRGVGYVTHISYALDYPLLDKSEMVWVEDAFGPILDRQTVTFHPKPRGLFTMGDD